MAKPTIAIDVDDVLANSTEALRVVVNERFDVNLSPEDYQIKSDYWQHYKTVWQQHGLADRISLQELEPMMETNQAHVFPHEDAFLTLQRLREHYSLIVVTSRPKNWRVATEQWLDKYFPNIFIRVLFTENTKSAKPKSKGELCVENNVSWLIDDNVDHARSAHDRGIEVILFGDYGWQHTVPPHFFRCKNWQEVERYFDGRG